LFNQKKPTTVISNKMMRPVLILFMVFLMTGLTVHAEGKKKKLFPEMKGWSLQVGEQVYTSNNLWNIINGAADAYLSYDFQKLFTAEYINDQDKRLKVYIFEHSTPTNAFGIYSQERSNDYTFVSTGAQGFKSEDAYYFINGPYYVQISTNDQGLSKEMKTLASQIEQNIDHPGELPQALNHFPTEGLVKNSEKYIAANFMGYSYLHSAFVADYKKQDQSFRVFIIHPEKQQAIGEMLTKYFDFVEQPADKREGEVIKVEDPYNGEVWLYRHGKYLAGVTGTGQPVAKEYIGLLRQQLK